MGIELVLVLKFIVIRLSVSFPGKFGRKSLASYF